jgi:hypothetical protein
MRRYFYYDLHCHTDLSPDAPLTVKRLVKMAKKKDFKETIDEIHSQGGFAVWAHPLRKEGLLEKHKDIYNVLDGLEAGNAMDLKSHFQELKNICKKEGLLATAGSDAHVEGQVGTAVLKTSLRITKENFKEAVKEGELIVREEIVPFRESNQVWKKRLFYFLRITKIDKLDITMNLFCKIVFRNYSKINNLHLRKIDFNYQDEETV